MTAENSSSGTNIKERISEETNKIEDHVEKKPEDAISIVTKDCDFQSEIEQEIVVPGECAGSFGNIVVKNSSAVQFGNKTHIQYEGPVTIKQFVEGDEETVTDENYTKNDESNDIQSVIKENKENQTQFSKGTNWLNFIHKKRKLFICLSIVFAILLILLIVLLVNKHNTVPSWKEETNLSGKLRIIQRKEWLAELPKDELDSLSLPVPYVIIAHTAAPSCTNRGKCTESVRYTQHYHMKTRGWSDIGYNFLVGGDGYVYEGRGWEKVGAHTKGWNVKSIGIAFIGTFEDILPPRQQILAAKMLIELGVKKNCLAQDYKLYAHLQLSDKLNRSPGEVFYEDIKTWPHWSNRSNTNK